MSIDLMIELKMDLIRCEFKGKRPVEKWKDFERRNRPKSSFRNYNYAVKCGTKIEDGYLMVLDVDPRNGGHTSLMVLQRGYGSLPPTLTVETGSGGQHYYFISDKPFPKCKLGNGLDGQGTGSYVIGPGSTHPNGKKYIIDKEMELAAMPDWFWDVSDRSDFDSEEMFFDATKFQDVDDKEFRVGSRNEMLTKVAGSLRREGAGHKEILEKLKAENKLKCCPPLSDSEIKAISKSILKYQPSIVVQDKVFENQKTNLVLSSKKMSLEKRFSLCYQNSSGLVKNIAETILEHSPREYPQFALASALSIVSAASQGSFFSPDRYGKIDSGHALNLFQWIVAPSAAGKDSYIRATATYLTAISEYLVVGESGSSHGLRNHLYAHNTLVSVIDEMQDAFGKLRGSGNSYLKDLLTDMKLLYNTTDKLLGSTIKGKRYPAILYPSYGLFGAGTDEGFNNQLSGDIISGGLISRFSIWRIWSVPMKNRAVSKMKEIPRDQLKMLKAIFKEGQTTSGALQSFSDIFDRYDGQKDHGMIKSAADHIPQFARNRKKLLISDEAEKIFDNYAKRQEARFRKMVYGGSQGGDLSPASIIDRSDLLAQKLGTLLAIGNGTDTVGAKEAAWGIELADCLSGGLVELIGDNAANSGYEKNINRVKKYIKRFVAADGLIDKTKVVNACHMPANQFNEILIHLAMTREITIINRDGKGIIAETLNNKIPYGFKCYIGNVE